MKFESNFRVYLVRSFFFATTLLLQRSAAVKTRLTWVNGIGHNLNHMEEGQGFISQLFGNKRVIFCHNPTGMANEDDMLGYLGDLTQAGTQKLGWITAEVDSLVKHLREAIRVVGKRGRVIHIAHSQGALITALAAKQLSPLEMNQIEVISFGGAAALRKTAQTPFQRCINYYSVNDPLLFVVPSAAQALRSGFVGDDEFCFLTPRIGDPIADHNLLGPTYAQALEWEGLRFQQKYQSIAYRAIKSALLLLISLLQAFSARLHVLLKAILRPLLLWSILCYMWTRTMTVKISRCLEPAVAFLALLVEWLQVAIRSWRGEEKFVPVTSSSMDSLEETLSIQN